jgi:hypothetical protein
MSSVGRRSNGGRYFRLINPLNPPPPNGAFGHLSDVATETATWFFADPGTSSKHLLGSEQGRRQTNQIEEAIDAALAILHELNKGTPSRGGVRSPPSGLLGLQLVDFFCDRFMRKQRPWRLKLPCGREINQRQLLCAVALHMAEQTAQAIAAGKSKDVCNFMVDLSELVCEIRRCLDREAGADIAARRARSRHQKTYQMRGRAYELYEAGSWPSMRKASQAIHEDVRAFARSIKGSLSVDRGQQTVYEWLCAYKKTTQAQQT